jgi:predicted nucleic acid-binding Zn ribbon protein
LRIPPFPETPCVVCRKPIDLQIDLCADENGKAVHADCYMKRITSSRLAQAWANTFSLSTNPDAQRQQVHGVLQAQ